MSPKLKSVADQALELTPEDREQLACRLVDSLDDERLTEVDEAWLDVAERRFDELVNGDVEGIPGEQVTDSIRRELGWKD